MFQLKNFSSLESTNLYCKNNWQNLSHNSVIIAEKQTAGYGTLSKKWLSPKGKNLYCSVVIKEILYPSHNYSLFMVLAILQVLQKLNIQAEFKWPNDILIDKKKVSGILIENIIYQEKPKALIIGLGLNINSDEQELQGLDQTATSLKIAYTKDKKDFSIKEVLTQILTKYQSIINKFSTQSYDILEELNNSHPLYTKEVKILHKNKTLEGTFMGFTENGNILIHTNGYKMHFDNNARIIAL